MADVIRSHKAAVAAALALAAMCALEIGASQTARTIAEEIRPTTTQPGGMAADGKIRQGAIVTIDTDISNVTTESLKRRVDHAISTGAEVIIFEMNTPGGLVSSALDICNYIKSLESVKTVAWVHNDAYSAGSMISMACNEIVMSPASTIGDCGVILGGPTGPSEVPENLRAKAESPVLEQFRDSASRNGYDLLLCEALVVKERVVYWIENTASGERRFVNQEDKERLVGGGQDDSPFAPKEESSAAPEWTLVESYHDVVTGKESPISEPVVPATELLTMGQSKAVAFGIAKGIVRDVDELGERYGLADDVPRLTFSWSERFTGWLTSMYVRTFLIIIIMLGAYVEFNTPGVGVPGLVALICLAIFIGAPYLTGLASIWEIVLILIGFVLLALEIFVIPGFGLPGIAGILCVIVGLLATFIPDEPGRSFPIYWPSMESGVRGLKYGVLSLGVGCAASIAGMALMSKMLPRMHRFLPGVVTANPTHEEIATHDPYDGYARVGDVGQLETTLRPSGKARFGPQLVDVVSEGEFIDPPAEVEVTERRGNRVVVRRFTEA